MIHGNGVSNIVSGLVDVCMEPTPRVPDRPACLYLHSAASDAREAQGASLPATLDVSEVVVDQCCLAVSGTTHTGSYGASGLVAGDSVGAAAYRGRIEANVAWHRTHFSCTSGPIGIYATSLGTENGLIYALEHPADVAWMVLMSPVPFLKEYYDDNYNSQRASLASGWNITYPAAWPAKADIYARRAELVGIPILAIPASDDGYSRGGPYASKWATFVADAGITTHNVGAVGHGNGTTAAADKTVIRAFIDSHS